MTSLLLPRQYALTPVWFNVDAIALTRCANWHWNHGTGPCRVLRYGYKTPQCSACFINSSKTRSTPSSRQPRPKEPVQGGRYGDEPLLLLPPKA
jgi:hypothetical protein